MRNKLFFIVMLCCGISSCTSYRTINSQEKSVMLSNSEHSYAISEFDVFTFNICETYDRAIDGTERFMECPLNFYEVSESQKIKKVEELYLLKHKNSDLIIYMTSLSHKYIRPQRGFLNDSTLYNNKFYLRDTEYIYIGKYNSKTQSMLFKNQKNEEQMLWYCSENIENSAIFTITKAAMETIENKDDVDKTITMKTVFGLPLKFNICSYELLTNKKDFHKVNKVSFKEKKKDKMEVLFTTNASKEVYRFPHRKVRYFIK